MSTPSVTVTRTRKRRVQFYRPRPSCTACGAPLLDGVGMLRGRLVRNALFCSACGRMGVHCECQRPS